MKSTQILIMIKWLKRIFAVITIGVWFYMMMIFIKDPAPFNELVPYCMGSTMLIFGILTGLFKGLEYWETYLMEEDRE